MNQNIIIIAGPTASGKTDLSIQLAHKINGEIISADSMQVYKYMDIGTAKPSIEERQGIKHYLIDEVLPNEDFSIAIFQKKAKNYIQEILSKNKIPIIVGGTGFYINSIIYDNNFMETNKDETYRNYLFELAKKNGNEFIFEMLKNVDAESCEKIHPNNLKRVVRALEYFKETGEKISVHNEKEKNRKAAFGGPFFIVTRDRGKLYERINLRVDFMIKSGLVDEVNNLLTLGYSSNLVSMQGIGYKEIVQYIEGIISLEKATEIIKQNTRKYAKRQITWFKNQCEATWIDLDKENDSIDIISSFI